MTHIEHAAGNRLGRTAGFTILELLVVMAVGATLLGTTVVAIRPGLAAFRANGAMSQVKSQLHFARELAISRQRDILLKFESDPARLEFRQANPEVDEDEYPVVGSILLAERMAFHRVDGAPAPVSWCTADAADLNESTDMRFAAGTGTLVNEAGALMNGCFYLADPTSPANTARALSLFGTTGRVGTFRWVASAWTH